MDRPEACLSPAVCYHVYHLHENQTLPAAGISYGICGKCFRYESSNISDLRRLWDFTMREVVFLGNRDTVLTHRTKSVDMMAEFLDAHRLAGEVRTASDPFFVAPDAVSKTYFQLNSARLKRSVAAASGRGTTAARVSQLPFGFLRTGVSDRN